MSSCCRYFDEYLPGMKRIVFHTKKGLSWRNAWGVMRYAANNAFLAFVHSQHLFEQARPHLRLQKLALVKGGRHQGLVFRSRVAMAKADHLKEVP